MSAATMNGLPAVASDRAHDEAQRAYRAGFLACADAGGRAPNESNEHLIARAEASASSYVDVRPRLREASVEAAWLASFVIDRLGGNATVPEWVAQSAAFWRDQLAERDRLSMVAERARDAVAAIEDWLGSASTREAALDTLWRLRLALSAIGHTPAREPLQWRGSVLQAMARAGVGVGEDDELRLVRPGQPTWQRARGERLVDVLAEGVTILARLREALGSITDGAPTEDPGEGNWDSCEDAYYAGVNKQSFDTAQIARAALAAGGAS